jgi:RNA polymerase sigma-54 factor
MALSPKLEFRQTQSLVMTPQLQQAIKLLQLSNLELSAYVEQELERNPILERVEEDRSSGDAGDSTPAADDRGDAAADGAGESDFGDGDFAGGDDFTAGDFADGPDVDLNAGPSGNTGDAADGTEALDTDFTNDYANDSAADMVAAPPDDGSFALSNWGGGGGGGGDGEFGFEQVLSSELSLKDHLREQLGVAIRSPGERLIGAEIIESLDESGYVGEELSSIAGRLGCAEVEAEQVLEKLQAFDPVGVFARDLKECLALQLKDRDRYDPAMQAMVEHLDLLASFDIPALMRVCGVDEEDIRDMIAELKALDPKPGLIFDHEVAAPVIPDVFVTPAPDGGWSVTVNSETLPRLLVDRQYYASVSGQTRKREEKAYLSECLQSANWLVKSLDQRARTILKVATELVRQQDAFLTHGVQHLRPLNLRTIAEAVDIHESTVSRVTSNKYMATPRGIFELKYFFTSAIASSAGGEDLSSEAVRQRIRDLIDAESPAKVLSDDKLVELLRASGIDIARRTVAKYREAMGIPSSVQRRRAKRLRA